MSVIPHLYDLEKPFRMMERNFHIPENYFGFSPFGELMPRQFCGPSLMKPWEDSFRPSPLLSSSMKQLALNKLGKISMDDKKFQINLDVQHFSPEELNVKVVDRHVIVEGKHEEKKDEHGYIARQFVRRYALPKECLPDTVESKLSSDGVLTVTAPKYLAMPSIGEKIVPIQPTGPITKKLVASPEQLVEEK